MSLIPIHHDGTVRGFDGALPEVATEAFRATIKLYASVGFEEPWIG